VIPGAHDNSRFALMMSKTFKNIKAPSRPVVYRNRLGEALVQHLNKLVPGNTAAECRGFISSWG
jgi:hypothetical protein